MRHKADHIPADVRLGDHLKRCEQALMSQRYEILRDLRLTWSQYAAMLALSEHPGISSARLSRYCGVTAQSMTGIVALLERRGHLVRTRSEAHARVMLLSLTRSGAALFREADQALGRLEVRLLQAFSAEQTATFRQLLDTAADALSGPADTSPH